MKKQYTKKQIVEAINYWKKQLRAGNYKKLNENVDSNLMNDIDDYLTALFDLSNMCNCYEEIRDQYYEVKDLLDNHTQSDANQLFKALADLEKAFEDQIIDIEDYFDDPEIKKQYSNYIEKFNKIKSNISNFM